MKVFYGKDFSTEERKMVLPTICANIMAAVQNLIKQAYALDLDAQVQAIDSFKSCPIDDAHWRGNHQMKTTDLMKFELNKE